MAPVMQQSIEILMLPVLELQQVIEQQLEANPLLEIDEAAAQAQFEGQPDQPFAKTLSAEIQQMVNASDDSFFPDSYAEEPEEPLPINETVSLEEKLLRQLHIDLTDPLKIRIGEMIIGQLDENGYLTTTCEEIAQALNLADVRPVVDVLNLIQSYEPAGIAARDLRECLLIQARALFQEHEAMAVKIIENHLENLGRKRYDLIAKELKVPLEHVRHCARLLATLEPKPARNDRVIAAAHYIKPDILVYPDRNLNGQYRVEVNEKSIPPLRINPLYRKMLQRGDLSDTEKEFLRERLQHALAFIKSVQQRGTTMKRIAEYILEKQQEFFEEGHRALAPMGLRDVAQAVDRNESTISRAISQKFIDTPQGIFPLKYFFSQKVGEDSSGNGGASNRSVKEEIKELVDEEDKNHPYSDHEIQQLLEQKGMNVARRTIGKYRKQLNILPSHLRKN